MSALRQRLLSFCGAVVLAASAAGYARADDLQYPCDGLAERAELSEFQDGLYQGGDGWFFRQSDFNHFYLNSTATRRFLTRLNEVMDDRGVKLVFLALPPKAVTEADRALEAVDAANVLYEPAFARDEFETLIRDFNAIGLHVVDLLGYMQRNGLSTDDAYFARDIHWRPEFAHVSAAATAEMVRGIVDPSVFDTKTFVTTVARTEEYKPNLSLLIRQLCSPEIPYEDIVIYETEEADASLDAFLEDDAGDAPVNVIGTSFTDEINRFNYAGFLREALGADVSVFAVSGGGVEQSIYQWTHRGIIEGTKVLVWELPYIERLEASAARLERQVIPAVAGRCEAAPRLIASTDYEVDADGRYAISIKPDVHIAGRDFYLNITLSDPTVQKFILRLTYRDGTEELVPLVRPDRVGALSDLFAELNPDIDADLAGVVFEAPGITALSGTLSICTYGRNLEPRVIAQN